MTTKSAETDAAQASVLWGLASLDAEIRAVQGGVPGSGIYALLDMLAGQFLGVPRGAYPAEPPPPPEALATQVVESEFEAKKHDPAPAAKPHAPAPNHRR